MKTEYSINYDAESIEEAKEYLAYRYKQIGKFGYSLYSETVVDGKSIVTIYRDPNNEGNWGSVYVLKQFRGNQVFIKNIQQFMIAIVTLDECNIVPYLSKRKINYISLEHSNAYRLIQKYYGDERTQRTGIPLIYHIDEGGEILNSLGSTDIVKDAYYLHPLFQSDADFNSNKVMDLEGIDLESIILAIEYRRVANSYLSNMKMSEFVGFSCEEVKQMLIADKIQNYKDFMNHHYGIHKRSDELYKYFHNWFNLLEINYSDWEFLSTFKENKKW